MDFTLVNQAGLVVVGMPLALQQGNSGKEIYTFWQNCLQKGVFAHIPDKKDSSLVGLYTDYTGSYKDPMALIVGATVSSVGPLPQGFVKKQIYAGTYAVFTATPEMGVAQIWQAIWAAEEKGLKRTYKSDFELYHMGKNPEDSVIQVYVGLEK